MQRYIPVEGHAGLVRDTSTNLIVNINKTELEEAKRRKQLRIEKEREQKLFVAKVDNLEREINEIKNLLNTIVEKL